MAERTAEETRIAQQEAFELSEAKRKKAEKDKADKAAADNEAAAKAAADAEAKRKADADAAAAKEKEKADTEAAAKAAASKKAEEAAATAPPPEQWEVKLDKKVGPIGMKVGTTNPTHMVCEQIISDGTVDVFNKSNPSQALKVGDSIVQVNDVKGDSEKMVAEMKAQSVLKLSMYRVSTHTVLLAKTGPLGLRIDSDRGVVKAVLNPGLAYEYNKSCAPGKSVSTGDAVTFVNGQPADPKTLSDVLRESSGDISLTFKRP